VGEKVHLFSSTEFLYCNVMHNLALEVNDSPKAKIISTSIEAVRNYIPKDLRFESMKSFRFAGNA